MSADMLAEILRLPVEERARLALELIRSLDAEAEAGAAEIWDAEIARRGAEVDAGIRTRQAARADRGRACEEILRSAARPAGASILVAPSRADFSSVTSSPLEPTLAAPDNSCGVDVNDWTTSHENFDESRCRSIRRLE